MHVEMITPGAAGTYYMKDFLGKSYNPLGWNPHRRNPRMPDNFKGRMVYLYSNPYTTILSYHRRGFLRKPFTHCLNIEGDLSYLSQKAIWSLEDFLEGGYDAFKIQEHFMKWYDFKDRNYDIMFIKYECLPQLIGQLLEWYELPQSLANRFDFKNRNSSYEAQSENIQKKLRRIFEEYAAFLHNLPDVQILR